MKKTIVFVLLFCSTIICKAQVKLEGKIKGREFKGDVALCMISKIDNQEGGMLAVYDKGKSDDPTANSPIPENLTGFAFMFSTNKGDYEKSCYSAGIKKVEMLSVFYKNVAEGKVEMDDPKIIETPANCEFKIIKCDGSIATVEINVKVDDDNYAKGTFTFPILKIPG